jgi:hypothetical protein
MKSTYADDLKFHDKLMELVLFFHGQLPHMTPPEEKRQVKQYLKPAGFESYKPCVKHQEPIK